MLDANANMQTEALCTEVRMQYGMYKFRSSIHLKAAFQDRMHYKDRMHYNGTTKVVHFKDSFKRGLKMHPSFPRPQMIHQMDPLWTRQSQSSLWASDDRIFFFFERERENAEIQF